MSIVSDDSISRSGARPDFSAFGRSGPFRSEQHQRVLDAAAALQSVRSRVAASVAKGACADARIYGPGPVKINEQLYDDVEGWREVLSVRPRGRVEELRVSLPMNRAFLSRAARMTSVFDFHGTTLGARLLLSGVTAGHYLFAVAPLQMKIIDGREVLLDGPPIEGQPTVMAVHHPACLAAAWAYWRAVLRSSFPCSQLGASPPGLTDRQRQIVGLLSAESGDTQIAATLDVSVRTVRSDIAALMDAFGVRTRFALGRAVAEHTADDRLPHVSPPGPGLAE